MGILLQRSKSRFVALSIAAWATIVAMMALGSRLGLNTVAAGLRIMSLTIILYASYRGAYAAFYYQKAQNRTLNVRTIVILSVISTALSCLVMIGIVLATAILGYDPLGDDSESIGTLMVAAVG